jgi:surface antigen
MHSPLRLAAIAAALSLSHMVFAQDYGDPLAAVGDCRAIPEQAEIDGVNQPVAARACLQPDGTWQMIRDDEDSSVIVYPVAAYPYPDPWYWGPPIFVGFGASFVFVDHFHHFHHFHRMGHAHFGGFHAHAVVPQGGFHGGMMHGSGGHHR